MTAECYPSCPCGACQQLRPPPQTPVGWWPCCGAIFQTRPHHGEYIGASPHAAHCKQAVGISMPKEDI